MKFASMIAFGVAPHAIGKGHPEGIIGGVHSNYYFNYPPANRWPLNTTFIKKSLRPLEGISEPPIRRISLYRCESPTMFTETFSKAFEDGGDRGKIILVGDPQDLPE